MWPSLKHAPCGPEVFATHLGALAIRKALTLEEHFV